MTAANCRYLLYLCAPALLCAHSANTPLTVLMDFDSPHSEVMMASLHQRLNRILRPTGITVDVKLKQSLPEYPQFGRLVVFRMKGSCMMTPLPIGALSDERGPLAMAFASDGQVLPFGEVECDRVRQSLERVLRFGGSNASQRIFGSALAVVMAHEIYHMLGNIEQHTHKGLTKPALTASELISDGESLPPGAVAEIEKSFAEIAP